MTILPTTRRAFHELLWFGDQQVQACLFGALLLAGLLLTRFWEPSNSLSRQDFLFLYAVGLQLGLLALRLERPKELVVIAIFHLLATFMEWFKTSPAIGSWQYPGDDVIFRIYQVPLFAGFLYSAVGSYIACAWRLLDFLFSRYPQFGWTVALAVLAYANFFTHHFIIDLRWPQIVAAIALFGPTWVSFRTGRRRRRMPLVLGLMAVAFFIYLAENLGTFAHGWVYPSQADGWHLVSFHKFWAWFLLMILSFVLVSALHRKGLRRR